MADREGSVQRDAVDTAEALAALLALTQARLSASSIANERLARRLMAAYRTMEGYPPVQVPENAGKHPEESGETREHPTYRPGGHWLVTIVQEGTEALDETGHRPDARLRAIVMDGKVLTTDPELAELVCELLNAAAPEKEKS
jgi:hypothetical protein